MCHLDKKRGIFDLEEAHKVMELLGILVHKSECLGQHKKLVNKGIHTYAGQNRHISLFLLGSLMCISVMDLIQTGLEDNCQD